MCQGKGDKHYYYFWNGQHKFHISRGQKNKLKRSSSYIFVQSESFMENLFAHQRWVIYDRLQPER